MHFVDDVLADFDGQLSYDDVKRMTYKEIGYMREHRRKNHPRDADLIAKALVGTAGSSKAPPKKQAPPSSHGKKRR